MSRIAGPQPPTRGRAARLARDARLLAGVENGFTISEPEGLKVAFLVCYAGLDSEMASRVGKSLRQIHPESKLYAILLRPDEFESANAEALTRLTDVGIELIKRNDASSSTPIEVLRALQPHVVVTTDDISPMQNAYVVASSALGAKVLHVQPGILQNIPFSIRSYVDLATYGITHLPLIMVAYWDLWRVVRATAWTPKQKIRFMLEDFWARFRRRKIADVHDMSAKIAVSGNYYRDVLAAQGSAPSKIVVTGLPRLDSYFDSTADEGGISKEVSAFAAGRKVVLFLPDAADQHQFVSRLAYLEWVKSVIRCFKGLEGGCLVIKPHPYEQESTYVSILREAGMSALVVRDANLKTLIAISDLVITGISTTGLETLILGRQLLIFKARSRYYPPDWEFIPFVREGVAVGVDNETDLIGAVTQCLSRDGDKTISSSARKRFLEHHLYLMDGRASERVARLILEIGSMEGGSAPLAEGGTVSAKR